MPSVVLPSLNVTVPVGIAPEAVLTVAVKVTVPPTPIDGLEEAKVVVVAAWFTVCAKTVDVLPAKLLSPL